MRTTREKASTIRAQLTRIMLIPSLCFLVLWLVVAAFGTARAVQLMSAVAQAREGTQILSEAAEQLRSERRLSLVYLGHFERGGPDIEAGDALDEQRETTDTAMEAVVALAEDLRGTRDDEVQRSAIALLDGPEALAEVRTRIDEHTAEQEEALLRYGGLLEATTHATTALVHTTDGGENLTDAVLTSELLKARSAYATADALLAGNIARGEMSYEETAHFTYLTASYRETLQSADAVMHPSVRARYDAVTAQPYWGRAEELSRQVVTRTPIVDPAPETENAAEDERPRLRWNTEIDVDAADWDDSSTRSVVALDDLVGVQAARTVDLAWSTALLQVALAAAAAVLTLVGGVAAIAVVGRSSRRLTDRLTRLRGQILERDGDLPGIVERVQRGEKVDVQEELPPLEECGEDEIGQVAEAFDTAQLTAVESAVRQAEIRRGANRAFLDIAFRNQTLVQRQLRLLDEIEYHEQEPEALRRLFRLDHLVTRARRYADNLIILGGGQSARRWRRPRPLVDVLRAAIAETEDFERVRLISAPRVLLHGQAVSDVVHLLAELVENATQFSPAGTPVDVSCTPVAEGLLVEIEDRGLGMSEHGYAAAERTLAQPPEFDMMAIPDDPRLGLFVVSRLAERHGVRVWLRPSSYGGTRATALLPSTLLEPVESPVTITGALTDGGGPTEEQGVVYGNGNLTPPDAGVDTGHAVPGHTGPQPFPVPTIGHDGRTSPAGDAHGPVRVPPPGHTGPQGAVPPFGHTGPQGTVPSSWHTGTQAPLPPDGRASTDEPAHRTPTPPRGRSED